MKIREKISIAAKRVLSPDILLAEIIHDAMCQVNPETCVWRTALWTQEGSIKWAYLQLAKTLLKYLSFGEALEVVQYGKEH